MAFNIINGILYGADLFGLFRTDPEAPDELDPAPSGRSPRHGNLTYLLVELDQPGITVRPVERLDGDEGFAEVFFDDAFVPDDMVLGGVNEGWAVAMATARVAVIAESLNG